MKDFFRSLSVCGLLVCGICMGGASVGAISEKTKGLSKEVIEVSDKAEENLKRAKKELEEALDEYFAAMRLIGIDEPTREVGERGSEAARPGYSSVSGNFYKGVIKKYKEIIQKDIEETYSKAIEKNKTQKNIYEKNLSKES